MNKFTQRVEELLQTEDPQLYKALGKIFKKTGGSERRGRRVGGNSFLHTLKSLLFPHIQKMFVGKFISQTCNVFLQLSTL